MRALWLADALRGAGLNVVEQPGWTTRDPQDRPGRAERRADRHLVVLTTPNWSVQDYDTDSMFTPFDNKIYAPYAGTYLVSFKVTFASAATGQREAFVGVSGGATRHAGVSVPVGSTAAAVVLSSAAEVDLTAGAYVQVYTYQTSGAGLNAMNDTTDYFSLRFLGPT